MPELTVTINKGRDCYLVQLQSATPEPFGIAIARLKEAVPASRRRYNPELNLWEISAAVRGALAAWAFGLTTFFDVEIMGDALPETQAADSSPYAALWLRDGAPLDVVKAVYRALALRTHPDRGGSTEEMQRLNAAYEQIVSLQENDRS